jgi:predicted TIM-barrel fold metal-dependent hydrolase
MTADLCGTAARTLVADCDIHNELPSVAPLVPYLPDHWVAHFLQTEFKGPSDTYYPPIQYLDEGAVTARIGEPGEGGERRMTSLEPAAVRAYLDRTGAEVAILNCCYAVDSLHNPDQAVTLARAVNDWQIAEWLEGDSRLRASLVLPIQIPSLAIEEIERVGGHPGFVQALLPARSAHPYGSRLYHELWAALVRHDLVAGIHFGGAPGNPSTPVGWPSYYFEEYVGMASVFAAQVTSLVTEGVFQQFPDMRVTLSESGCTWLPSHMWRFNKDWKNLRSLTPWLKRSPAEYIRDHVHLTLEPLDEPNAGAVERLADRLGSEDMLMYSTDFPHRSAEPRALGLKQELPTGLASKVLWENAKNWYRLEAAP